MNQQIRFCKSFDATRIAYTVTGSGEPVVRAPHWLTHLEYEFLSPVWRPWIEAFSRRCTLLRMDERACGLSDWDPPEVSFEAWVRDLEAVVDAAGFERFTLFGHSQGASIAIEYAVRHPERVSRLVILGGYAYGAMKRQGAGPERIAELEAQLKLVEAGWGREEATYRQMFAMSFMPNATMEQVNSLAELQRRSASPANAARIIQAFFNIDVEHRAPLVACEALLLHARGDRRAPFEEGRLLASLIPDARLVPLETENHVLLEQEPAFRQFFEELEAFLPRSAAAEAAKAFAGLTGREAQILERIAQGLDNAQIAAHLGMSEKTVRNHITRVFDKIGVENRAQAIVRARERGLGRESR